MTIATTVPDRNVTAATDKVASANSKRSARLCHINSDCSDVERHGYRVNCQNAPISTAPPPPSALSTCETSSMMMRKALWLRKHSMESRKLTVQADAIGPRANPFDATLRRPLHGWAGAVGQAV
nr:hypothetical protein [Burkholderia stagnalis]